MPFQQPLDFSQFSGKTFQLQDPKFQQNIPSFPRQEQDISRFFTEQQQGTYSLHKCPVHVIWTERQMRNLVLNVCFDFFSRHEKQM